MEPPVSCCASLETWCSCCWWNMRETISTLIISSLSFVSQDHATTGQCHHYPVAPPVTSLCEWDLSISMISQKEVVSLGSSHKMPLCLLKQEKSRIWEVFRVYMRTIWSLKKLSREDIWHKGRGYVLAELSLSFQLHGHRVPTVTIIMAVLSLTSSGLHVFGDPVDVSWVDIYNMYLVNIYNI